MDFFTQAVIAILAIGLGMWLGRNLGEKVARRRSGSKKASRKQKIMELLAERGELANEDIRQELNVSKRSVVNYMDELEAEGKVEQVGSTGRDVHYRLR